MRIIFTACAVVGLFALVSHAVYGQQIAGERDTVKVEPNVDVPQVEPAATTSALAQRFNPRKAILYAAVLPGSGQVYNKKYWKLPIVYGGFGILIYQVSFYQQQYNLYLGQLYSSINDPTATNPNGYSQDQLRSLVDEARRERDYFMVLTGFWYILQLVDAHVDSHLKEFEINPKLKVSLQPHSERSSLMGRSNGVRLLFKF